MKIPAAWWKATGNNERRRFFPWPRRSQPRAQPPLRIAAQTSIPSAPGSTICGPTAASTVGLPWQFPAAVPELVTTVSLDSSAGPAGGTAVRASETTRRRSDSGTSIRGSRAPAAGSLAARLRLLLAPPWESLLPGPNSVLQWPADLMPFQRDGVRTLIGAERLLLADDMGLGKTLQVIAALRVMFQRRAIGRALVVTPATILDQWRQELNKWAPELRAIIIRGNQTDRAWQWDAGVHVTFVSYDTLRSDFGGGPQVRRPADGPGTFW